MKNKVVWVIGAVICFILLFTLMANLIVFFKTKNDVITDLSKAEKTDAIIVMSAGVIQNGPNEVTKARIDKAIELYRKNIAKTIIMAGGDLSDKIDTPLTMKKYAVKMGIPESDIKVSYSGNSTYSILKKVANDYKLNSAFIVTQKYHLYRSIYIANKFGIDAYGYEAENAGTSFMTKAKEILIRTKDFVKCVF